MKNLFLVALLLAVLLPTMSFAQAADSTLAYTIIRNPKPGFGVFGFPAKNNKYSSINGLLLAYANAENTNFNGLSVGAACTMFRINGASIGIFTRTGVFNGLNVSVLSHANKFRGVSISGFGIGNDTTYGIQFATISPQIKMVKGIDTKS